MIQLRHVSELYISIYGVNCHVNSRVNQRIFVNERGGRVVGSEDRYSEVK
jgi:hypothetical protein